MDEGSVARPAAGFDATRSRVFDSVRQEGRDPLFSWGEIRPDRVVGASRARGVPIRGAGRRRRGFAPPWGMRGVELEAGLAREAARTVAGLRGVTARADHVFAPAKCENHLAAAACGREQPRKRSRVNSPGKSTSEKGCRKFGDAQHEYSVI